MNHSNTPASLSRRPKPYVNLGVLGQFGHGKTTLAGAISEVLEQEFRAKCPRIHGGIESAPEARRDGATLSFEHSEFETELRRYSLVDCPLHRDYVENMIIGIAEMDGAILVVSVLDGTTTETREQLQFVRRLGLRHLVVFLNKCDFSGMELTALAEEEVRTVLLQTGFPGSDVPVIRGSARRALEGDSTAAQAIHALLAALDETIPTPEPASRGPFLMAVEDVLTDRGRAPLVLGRVERGRLEVGDPVEVVGFGNRTITVATGLEMFRKPHAQIEAGDNVGLHLRDIETLALERGHVLAAPGSIGSHSLFEAELYVPRRDQSGHDHPLKNGATLRFHLRTSDLAGSVRLADGVELIAPGGSATATVELAAPIPLEPGLRFAVRDDGRNQAAGIVTRIPDASSAESGAW